MELRAPVIDSREYFSDSKDSQMNDSVFVDLGRRSDELTETAIKTSSLEEWAYLTFPHLHYEEFKQFFIASLLLPDAEILKKLRLESAFPSIHSPDEFFSVLSKNLISRGFTRSQKYLDPFDGNVVDFSLNSERITCIVSADAVQILSYVKCVFSEKLFQRTENAKLEITEYIQTIIETL